MQFSVCTIDECNEHLINKCKIMLGNFLEKNNIDIHTLPKIKVIRQIGQNTVAQNNQNWHIDDISIINFVINIKGEGTEFYNDDTKQIEQLGEGNGIFLIGEQGSAFFGLKPTIHKAPTIVSDNRIIIKFIIDSSDKIEGYMSNIYHKRLKESEQYLQTVISTF